METVEIPLPKKTVTKASTPKTNENYWEKQCVAYAKKLTGHYGTWGNGGRSLSANSNGEVGDVIIFDYNHVGVIIRRIGEVITYTDRNSDYKGKVRLEVQILASDPSIWKFHRFN